MFLDCSSYRCSMLRFDNVVLNEYCYYVIHVRSLYGCCAGAIGSSYSTQSSNDNSCMYFDESLHRLVTKFRFLLLYKNYFVVCRFEMSMDLVCTVFTVDTSLHVLVLL